MADDARSPHSFQSRQPVLLQTVSDLHAGLRGVNVAVAFETQHEVRRAPELELERVAGLVNQCVRESLSTIAGNELIRQFHAGGTGRAGGILKARQPTGLEINLQGQRVAANAGTFHGAALAKGCADPALGGGF